MSDGQNTTKIIWYRSPVDRQVMKVLNERSDWKGFVQSMGHLGLLMFTGCAAWYAVEQFPLWTLFPILFIHGTLYAFLLNGFHELCHKTVFKSKFLNIFFLKIFSFLGLYNHVMFWASHAEHHKFTLHPPDDLEVVFPVKFTLKGFLQSAIVNPLGYYNRWKGIIRISFGKLEGEWENALFPEEAVEKRRQLFNWSRIMLVGHILLVVASLYFGLWLIPVLTTLAPLYGGWLLFLCNNTQHVGLQDNTSDYRLCTRTIVLPAFVQFLYWHMNFHIEHHMYAAVPCYNLKKLHEAIKDDLPYSPNLVEAWQEITAILKRQETEPTYQYVPELPTQATI